MTLLHQIVNLSTHKTRKTGLPPDSRGGGCRRRGWPRARAHSIARGFAPGPEHEQGGHAAAYPARIPARSCFDGCTARRSTRQRSWYHASAWLEELVSQTLPRPIAVLSSEPRVARLRSCCVCVCDLPTRWDAFMNCAGTHS
jgi:hypothetical protein